jgi:hypothetical protein
MTHTYHSFGIATAFNLGIQLLMVYPSSFSTQQNPEDLLLAVLMASIIIIGASLVELFTSIKKIRRK